MLSLTLFKTSFNKHGCKTIAYLFILLFTYAAVSKLLDFDTFTVQLAQSPLLSAYAGAIAWLVPGIEIGIALLLVFPQFRTLALYASFTLMVLFTAYIFIILNFSDFIPCSCGGVLEQLSWTQHLIFNGVFILLSAVAIFVAKPKNTKKMMLALTTLTLMGIATVTVLFAFSEEKMHRNNAFQRRYPHQIATEISRIDTRYNSYYFAGITEDSIYLGNITAPIHLLVVGKKENDTVHRIIQLPDLEFKYHTLKTIVSDSIFYIWDGSIPIIFKGNTTDFSTTENHVTEQQFLRLKKIATDTFAIRIFDPTSTKNVLGKLKFRNKSFSKLQSNLLKAHSDPFFDTDGLLLYNQHLEKILYVYFYRNEFVVTNSELNLDYIGKTIDTISRPELDIRTIKSKNQRKMGKNPIFVNLLASTYGKYLFIHSDRLGKFESHKVIKTASIIDVYNITNKTYAFSFYLYHRGLGKLKEFRVEGQNLYALIDHYLVTYKLEKSDFLYIKNQ